MDVTVGSVVVRRSYSGDIYFVVVDIRGDIALLKGVYQRLMADAPLDDLIQVSDEKKERILQQLNLLNKLDKRQ
mgnify:CR=1 FL=1